MIFTKPGVAKVFIQRFAGHLKLLFRKLWFHTTILLLLFAFSVVVLFRLSFTSATESVQLRLVVPETYAGFLCVVEDSKASDISGRSPKIDFTDSSVFRMSDFSVFCRPYSLVVGDAHGPRNDYSIEYDGSLSNLHSYLPDDPLVVDFGSMAGTSYQSDFYEVRVFYIGQAGDVEQALEHFGNYSIDRMVNEPDLLRQP